MIRPAALLLLAVLAGAADSWDRLAEISRRPPAEAAPELEKLLLQEPGFLAARFNLGTILLGGDPAKAAEQLELATAATDPGIAAGSWHNLALARFRQGRLEEALAAAERAAKLDPQAGALRDEIRRVTLARRDEARRKAEEEARKLHLDPAPLPSARVGRPYQARVPVAGGAPPATVALDKDVRLPDGLTLAADGTISGTPRTAGTTHLALVLRDTAKAEVKASSELRVLPPPVIVTATLPEGVVGQPYRADILADGFDGPVRFTITTLPDGLTGGDDGVISGLPTTAGTVTVHVHASDGDLTADRLIDLAVVPDFAPAEQPLPPATATAAYQHRATVRGPAQDYRWSAGPGATLAIAPDGTVTGTPAKAGDVNLPVVIQAADGRSRSTALTIPVNPPPLITPDPIQMQAGTPVDRPLVATGGTPPLVWSLAEGVLPSGLRLDADGHLRGVVRDPGTSSVTVAVVDRWKAATQAKIELKVEPASETPPQAQQQEKQDQQDKQDQQAKQDQKQQGQQGQQQQGQQGQQGQQKPKDQNGQQGQQQQAQRGKSQNTSDQDKQGEQAAAAAGKDDASAQAAAQAAALNQTAADHWLDQLPAERRDSLRYQLLDGGDKAPANQGRKTW